MLHIKMKNYIPFDLSEKLESGNYVKNKKKNVEKNLYKTFLLVSIMYDL